MKFKFYNAGDLQCAKCTHEASLHMPSKCSVCENCDFFLDHPQGKLFIHTSNCVEEIIHPLKDHFCVCGGNTNLLYKIPLKMSISSDFESATNTLHYFLYRCKACSRLDIFDITDSYLKYLKYINSEH